ncbi:hypothetical protein [Endozoicomonas lisbonensis]|uniref:hypothetical protein n=1 Tax=Endozoicomonas lisbonensis TaxID=3120522 RepID=UPI003398AA1D
MREGYWEWPKADVESNNKKMEKNFTAVLHRKCLQIVGRETTHALTQPNLTAFQTITVKRNNKKTEVFYLLSQPAKGHFAPEALQPALHPEPIEPAV